MGGNTDILATLYIVWIAASMSVLMWAYRDVVKNKLFGSIKSS